jgi:Na+/melibiose symporter-like transporter
VADSAPAPVTNGKPLSWATIIGFGQLAVPLATAGLPIAVYITYFYAQDLRLNLADVGFILLVARIADFAVDPIIGWASDHTRWGFGRRRTWVLLGAPIFALGVYMLFLPPDTLVNESADARRWYLLLWIAVFYLGWTMITIPYGAWGAELSNDYNERSRITGVREVFTLVGLALAGVIPVLMGSGPAPEPGVADGAANGTLGEVMMVMGLTIVGLTPLGVVILWLTTPEPPIKEMHTISFWKGVKVAATNWPFVRLFCATVGIRIGSKAVESLLIFYLVDAVGLLEKDARMSLLALLVSAIVFAPFWIWAGKWWTKHKALSIAIGMGIAIFGVLPFLQDMGFWPNIIAFAALGVAFSAPFTLGQSIAADVIDLDAMKTRQPRAGLLISFFGLAIKGADAVGVGMALIAAGYLGYDPQAEVKTAEAIQTLTAVYVLFPVVFWIPAIALLWNFPITPAVQKRIRQLIERRIRIEQEVHRRRQAAHTSAPAPQTRRLSSAR